MKLKLKYFNDFTLLIPLIMVFVGEIVSYIYPFLSSPIKVLTCVMLIFPIWLKIKIPSKLLFALLVFIFFFIIAFTKSFNYKAALEDGIRYFFPIAVLLYGYYNKHKLNLFVGFIIIFTLLNFLVQLNNYYYYYIDPQRQWFYIRYFIESQNKTIYWPAKTFGVLRATGLVIFFGAFGILNFMAFWLTYYYYFGRYRKLCLVIFSLGVFISTSFKTIGFFLITLVIKYYKKLKYLLILPPVAICLYFLVGSEIRDSIEKSIEIRLRLYVTEGNSARSESYRAMFNEFKDFNLLGEGIGVFGGPASTKYNSPYYDEIDFNWYDTTLLATTDTYYPHLFVEMGILGGLSYLFVLLIPLMYRRMRYDKLEMLCIVYGMLFFDSLFSFSLNNLVMLTITILFVYPILYNKQKTLLEE
ncbi:hypothetical protein [Winogradskyella arenosi]|uniref:O-antigen ligase-like membrane protein n=1 Tax=Winogradskyella arenosi TaxID=533325 RepID=A0A368ZK95_9FLAO|nr:hypothetical protein [Winogradskyella arenosi]RCW93567.1 hypothetical protein DFQ08_101362 [Winogradskyella arenosi]